RLDRGTGRRPTAPADQRRPQMQPQAAGGNDDPHRPGEQRGIAADLGEERVEALHQQRLGGEGSLGDQDLAGRIRRLRGNVEKTELHRHVARIPREGPLPDPGPFLAEPFDMSTHNPKQLSNFISILLLAGALAAGCGKHNPLRTDEPLPPQIAQLLHETLEFKTLPASLRDQKELARAWKETRSFYE